VSGGIAPLLKVSGQPHSPPAVDLGKNPGTHSVGDGVAETVRSLWRIEKQFLALVGIRTSDRPARILISIPTNCCLHWCEFRRTEHRIVFIPRQRLSVRPRVNEL
jgi:hypothetical protein